MNSNALGTAVLVILVFIGIPAVVLFLISLEDYVPPSTREQNLCNQLCTSNNLSMVHLEYGYYSNDVCFCQDNNGKQSTYLVS